MLWMSVSESSKLVFALEISKQVIVHNLKALAIEILVTIFGDLLLISSQTIIHY